MATNNTTEAHSGDKSCSEGAEAHLQVPQARLPPAEEAEALQESNIHKSEANTFFSKGNYDTAINKYDEAYAILPDYLDYELAVLKSNIAACHLKLDDWKESIKAATTSLERLDKISAAEAEEQKREQDTKRLQEEVEAEIISTGATTAGPALIADDDAAELAKRNRKNDIGRIRAKSLMRRARARTQEGGWSNLSGAEEDYKILSGMANLGAAERKIVESQLRVLPPKVKAAQEKETAEMWSKLKDLGNGLLKPFGLSTDNFQMKQDRNTGGYSMNFGQK